MRDLGTSGTGVDGGTMSSGSKKYMHLTEIISHAIEAPRTIDEVMYVQMNMVITISRLPFLKIWN